MKKTTLKPAFAVLTIALAVAGCNSGSSSSSGGGGGGSSANLVANTSGATAFAFLQGDQAIPAAAPALQATSAKTPAQFSQNSGACESLVKIIEVQTPDGNGGVTTEYKTEKVFSQGKSVTCLIDDVHMMKQLWFWKACLPT